MELKTQQFVVDQLKIVILYAQIYCQRPKKADDSVMKMAQKSLKQRLSELLLYSQDQFGVDSNGFLNINFSRKDYANLVGTSTESAIRMISNLNKAELIQIKGKQIKILKPMALKKTAEISSSPL